MARRSVSVTLKAGMISEEAVSGSVRYMENFVPMSFGAVPSGPVAEWTINRTEGWQDFGTSTAYGTKIGSKCLPLGWNMGGTWHPKFGFVGVTDIYRTTAAQAMSAVTSIGSAFYEPCIVNGIPSTDQYYPGMHLPQRGFARVFGGDRPMRPDRSVTATADFVKMTGFPIWTNTEDEAIHISRDGVTRYAGAIENSSQGLTVSTSTLLPTGVENIVTWCRPALEGDAAYTTGTYTSYLRVYGGSAFTEGIEGKYISLALGRYYKEWLSGPSFSSADFQQARTFRVKRVVGDEFISVPTATGNTTYNYQLVEIDGKIQLGATNVYLNCVISPLARLETNQMSASTLNQFWGNVDVYQNFTPVQTQVLNYLPRGDAGCYHQGRLFLANDNTICWSGTIDEVADSRATGVAYGSTVASGSATTGLSTSVNFGIEFSGLQMWGVNSFINVFPGIGGPICGLVSMGDQLVILKHNAIFRLVGGVSYNGLSNNLDLQIVSDSIGPESKFAWAKTSSGIVFSCNDAAWLYNGSELTDITTESIRTVYREHLGMGRRAFNSPYGVRVTSDGSRVFFSKNRKPLPREDATSGKYYTKLTESEQKGNSEFNKHLVLDMNTSAWSFMSNNKTNVPTSVIRCSAPYYVRNAPGNDLQKYDEFDVGQPEGVLWLNSWKPIGSSADLEVNGGFVSNWSTRISLVDIKDVFHELGIKPAYGAGVGTYWDRYYHAPESGHIVLHPLSGYGNMDSVRPRSLMLKRTLAAVATGGGVANRYAASGSVQEYTSTAAKVFVHNADSGFMPENVYSSTSNYPKWWDVYQDAEAPFTTAAYSDGIRSASMDDPGWQVRSRWDIAGTTSTGFNASTTDKILLNNIDSAMTSPIIHYRDAFWSNVGPTLSYESQMVHAFNIEIDEVENGADR